MIADYRSGGLNVSRILTLLKIPRSTHYYSPPSLQIRSGRKASMITERITDTGIMEITDEQLLLDITDLLGREFVCYGYKKVCKYLQRLDTPATGRRFSASWGRTISSTIDTITAVQPGGLWNPLFLSRNLMMCGRWTSRMCTYMERIERHTCLRSSTLTPWRLLENTLDITALPRR